MGSGSPKGTSATKNPSHTPLAVHYLRGGYLVSNTPSTTNPYAYTLRPSRSSIYISGIHIVEGWFPSSRLDHPGRDSKAVSQSMIPGHADYAPSAYCGLVSWPSVFPHHNKDESDSYHRYLNYLALPSGHCPLVTVHCGTGGLLVPGRAELVVPGASIKTVLSVVVVVSIVLILLTCFFLLVMSLSRLLSQTTAASYLQR